MADVSEKLSITNQTRPSNLGVNLGFGRSNDQLVRKASLPNGVYLIGGADTCNLNMSSTPSIFTRQGRERVTAAPRQQETSSSNDNGSSILPIDAAGTRMVRSLAFADQEDKISSAISNLFLVYTNETATQGPTGFQAAEVLFRFCINSYQVSTSGGISNTVETRLATAVADNPNGSGSTAGAADDTMAILHAPSSSSSSGDGDYPVNKGAALLLHQYLVSVFAGTYSLRGGRSMAGSTAVSDILGVAMFRGRNSISIVDDSGRGGGSETTTTVTENSTEERLRAVIGNLTQNVATSLTNT